MPTLHILAGPNGAGKSTLYATQVQPVNPTVEFVNADKLAAKYFGHNASTEAEAAKGQQLAEQRRAALMAERKSLITESTFSHPSKLELIQEAKALGYKVAVYHVNVRSPDISVARVKDRVTSGGHDVPEDRIRARYERSKALIKEAVINADRGLVFDNSRLGQPPEMTLSFERGQVTYASDRVPNWASELYAEKLKEYTASRLNPAAASYTEAKAMTQKILGEEAKTYIPRDVGKYQGEVIGQTAKHTLQQLNDKSVVAHFTDKLQNQPTMNSYATIQYRKDEAKASVKERPARAVAFEKQTEAEATKRYPELTAAYDVMRTLETEVRAKGQVSEATAQQFRTTLKTQMIAALDEGKLPKSKAKTQEPINPERKSPGRDR
jgi:predicted ABC-type ATPase